MKAILLAAGLGSRLKPYTDNWPKCLMPINKKPLIEYWLETLVSNGITEILINLHTFPDIVRDFVTNSKYKNFVIFSTEKDLLGTAGTIMDNLDFIKDSSLMLIHADNLCSCDFVDFINFHNLTRPMNTELTMMTFTATEPKKTGIVLVNDNGVVNSFYEKSSEDHGNIGNAAIYIIEPSVINWLSSQKNIFDFSTQVLPNYLNRIATWHNHDVLKDIGSEDQLLLAQNDLNINNHTLDTYADWKYFNNFKIIYDMIEKNK